MPTSQQSNSKVTLSARLSAIADSLPRDGVVCDVGSDHGALPLYLLKNNLCHKAIVTDLNEMPLQRAKNALGEAGVAERAVFLQADGICDTLPFAPTAFVIAGMGGETISGILSRARLQLSHGTTFVLQPMSRSRHLRQYLYENGFFVKSETAVSENGKVFLIFVAVYDGVLRPKDAPFYLFGEYLPLLRTPSAKRFFEGLLLKVTVKMEGKKQAGKDISAELEEKERLLSVLEAFSENSRD